MNKLTFFGISILVLLLFIIFVGFGNFENKNKVLTECSSLHFCINDSVELNNNGIDQWNTLDRHPGIVRKISGELIIISSNNTEEWRTYNEYWLRHTIKN